MDKGTAASLAEANETLYTSLTYGIALEQDRGDGRKSHTVRFLDFDKPSRNEWIVTRQYKVLGSKKHVIPDIVVFVNGLPLAVVECKSPTIGDTWKGRSRHAVPPIPGSRHPLEGPGRPEAVRGGADSRRHLRRARRLRHGRHPGAVLSRMEGAGSRSCRSSGRPSTRSSAASSPTAPTTSGPSSSSGSPPSRRSPVPRVASRRSAWTSSTTSLGSSPPIDSRPRWSRRAATPRSPTWKRWSG